MSYNNYWEKYPIENNEIWSFGESKISVNDITKSLPVYMYSADMIYCDPPWELRNVNMFNSKAGREYMNHFSEFYIHLFKHIKDINPKVCYLEVGKPSLSIFKTELEKIFPIVQQWDILYYKKNHCYLLRGGHTECDFDFTNIDDEVTPYEAVKYENPKIVADFCTGRGLTAVAAFKNDKIFVGTELNKRKLATLIHRSKKFGDGFKKDI